MRIQTQRDDYVEIWLTQEESHNLKVQSILPRIYAVYARQGKGVVLYRSGSMALHQQTETLIQRNVERLKQEVKWQTKT